MNKPLPGKTILSRSTHTVLSLILCAAVVTFWPCCSFSANQPYSIETEWGDVIGPDGKVQRREVPQPPPKDIPPPLSQFQTKQPSLLPEPEDITEKDLPIPEEPQEPQQEKPEPEPEPEPLPIEVKSEPEPEPEKPKPEKKPPPPKVEKPDKKPAPPSRPLSGDVSFTLDASELEYDPAAKTLIAKNVDFQAGYYRIFAQNITMDLSRDLLSASGRILVFPSDARDQHFTGEFLLLNLRTSEAIIRNGAGEETAMSLSYMGSYFENPENLIIETEIELSPMAGAPSLSGVQDVAHAPAATSQALHASYMRAEAGVGLAFYNVRYTNAAGVDLGMPVFLTHSGEWDERELAVRYVSAFHMPGLEYSTAAVKSEYFFSGNPHGKGFFSDIETHIWDDDDSITEHNFEYRFFKQYIRGNNVWNLDIERERNWLASSAEYQNYWFDGSGGFARSTLYNQLTDTELSGMESVNGGSLWMHKRTPTLILDLQTDLNTSVYDAADPSDKRDRRHREYQASITGIPRAVHGSSLLFGYSADLRFIQEEFKYGYFDNFYMTDSKYKTFRTYLLTEPYSLFGRVTADAGLEWYYQSYERKYEYGTYLSEYSYGDEGTRGAARIKWRFSDHGLLGVNYTGMRLYGQGEERWGAFATYSPSPRWSLRIGAQYRHEMAAEGVEYPENVYAETADLSLRLDDNTQLAASFDLDNYYHGAMLHNLSLQRQFPWGFADFTAYKSVTSFNKYYYAPYRYYLNIYFTR